MEIGAPIRVYTVVPVEDPLPAPRPAEPDETPFERRTEEPAEEREPVP